MSDLFSNDIPADKQERLVLAMEEMSEAVQAICKILRHGVDSYHPTLNTHNKQELEKEIGHVLFAVELLAQNGDVIPEQVDYFKQIKRSQIRQWLHFPHIGV